MNTGPFFTWQAQPESEVYIDISSVVFVNNRHDNNENFKSHATRKMITREKHGPIWLFNLIWGYAGKLQLNRMYHTKASSKSHT